MDSPIHDKEKSDVFTAGIIILQAATLADMSLCFDYYHCWYLEDKVAEKLADAKELYHDQLVYLIKDMINPKEKIRPNFKTVQSKVSSSFKGKKTKKV